MPIPFLSDISGKSATFVGNTQAPKFIAAQGTTYANGYQLTRTGHDTYRICLGNSEGLRIVNETDASREELAFDGAGNATFAGTLTTGGTLTTDGDIIAHASGGAGLNLRRDDTTISGTNALGYIGFAGDDPTDGTFNYGSLIRGRANGSWGTSSYPGELEFQTRNTSGSLTTALTLNKDQSATFAGEISQIYNPGNTGAFQYLKNANSGSSAYISKKWQNDDAGFGEIWRNSSTRNAGTGNTVSSFNMYNSAAINFWPGGSLGLTLDASQNATFTGDVTVGALTSGETAQLVINHEGGATPVAKFVSRTNRAQVQIGDNDTNGYLVAEGNVFSIGRTASASANNINIDANHNVGIGTLSPGAKLEVDGTSLSDGDTVFDVQGDDGQLFSVTNSLTGDLFSVSDISGIPILNVNSSGIVTVDGNIQLADNDKIQLGDAQDLELYHDGSNSYIKDTGTGNLWIQGSSQVNIGGANGEIGIQYVENANVTLRHNNAPKLTTTSTGAEVTGNLQITASAGDTLTLTKSTTEPSLRIEGDTDKDFVITVSGELLTFTQNDGATDILTLDHDTKNATFAGQVKVTSDIFLNPDYVNANEYLYLRKHQSGDGGIIFQSKTSGGSTQSDFQIRNQGTTGDLKFYAYGLAGEALILDRENGNATFAGTVTANGTTLTGDQDLSGYLLNTTDTFTGTLTLTHSTFGSGLILNRNHASNAASITFKNTSGQSGILYATHADTTLRWRDGTTTNSYKIWHEGNDGTGSGLDADTLDGQHGSYYLDYANFTSTPTIPTDFVSKANGGTFSGAITSSGAIKADGAIESRKNIVSNSNYNIAKITSTRTTDDYGGLNKTYAELNIQTPGPNTDGSSSAHGLSHLSIKLADNAGNTDLVQKALLRHDSELILGGFYPQTSETEYSGLTIRSRYGGSTRNFLRFQTDHSSETTEWTMAKIYAADGGNFNGQLHFQVASGNHAAGDYSTGHDAQLETAMFIDDTKEVTFNSNIKLAGANPYIVGGGSGAMRIKHTSGQTMYLRPDETGVISIFEGANSQTVYMMTQTPSTNNTSNESAQLAFQTRSKQSDGQNNSKTAIIKHLTHNVGFNYTTLDFAGSDKAKFNMPIEPAGGLFYTGDANMGFIPHPIGAQYRSDSSSDTGYILIKLPTAISNSPDDMISFYVDIYDYTTNEMISVFVGGYTYRTTSTSTYWYNCTAIINTKLATKDFTVRFGNDGTNFYVAIGETTSTWAHPSIVVRDFQCSYRGNVEHYIDGWAISTETTTLTGVDETQSGNLPATDWGSILNRPYIVNASNNSATATTTIANVAHATYTAAFFDFVIKNGTNVRAGTVYACHNGDSTPLVEFAETSTVDLGDTSDVTLSVDISGANMRLRATTTSSTWTIKSLIRAI